jgi:hypothetical protein
MVKLKLSQIIESVSVCPYCMNDYDGNWRGCCGEAHCEEAVVTADYECYLESEIEIEDDSELVQA